MRKKKKKKDVAREREKRFSPLTCACTRAQGVEREKEKGRNGRLRNEEEKKEVGREGEALLPHWRTHAWGEEKERRGEAMCLSSLSLSLFSATEFFVVKTSQKKERSRIRDCKEREENLRSRERGRSQKRERERGRGREEERERSWERENKSLLSFYIFFSFLLIEKIS